MSVPPVVLIDLTVAPPGAAGTYVEGLVDGLLDADVAHPERVVLAFAPSWADDHAERVSRLRTAGFVVDVLSVGTPGTWKARLGRGRVLRDAIGRHGAAAAFFPRDVAPRRAGRSVILLRNRYAWTRFHDSAAVGGSLAAWLLRREAARSAKEAATVLSVSAALAATLPTGVHADAVVPHGCALPEGEVSRGAHVPPRLVMVANLMAQKRIEDVIEAVASLRAEGRDWTLAVYGGRADPQYADRLEQLSMDRLGTSVLAGKVSRSELAAVLAESDVVVQSGGFEAFSNPLLEAMRSGRAIVAPDTDLIHELCGDVAVTYPEGDIAALSRALKQAIDEVEARSLAGVERARSFTWSATAQTSLEHVRAAAS